MAVHTDSTLNRRDSTPFGLNQLRGLIIQHADVLLLALVVLLSGWIFLRYNLALQPIPEDTTYHIYAAQQMLEGHPIYRDVAIIKTPLADFVTLLALVIGRPLRVDDTLSARLIFFLVGLGTVAVTYLAGRILFASRLIGVVAALVVGGNDFYAARMVTGPEPKSLVILFSYAALILVAKRHWGWAGICAALAALAWQPAAMILALVGGAALIAPWLAGKPVAWRTRAVWMPLLRTVAGMALPFLALGAYLGLNGALAAAYHATFTANLSHLGGETQGSPVTELIADNVKWISSRLSDYCIAPLERWQYVGALGFGGMLIAEGADILRRKRTLVNLEHTPFFLFTLGFIAFTLIDFNFCPDLFPLLPGLALAIGWLAWILVRGIGGVADRIRPHTSTWLALVLSAVIVVVVAGLAVTDAQNYKLIGISYADQLKDVRAAKRLLTPDSRVLAFGNAIVLTELHRDNASKIVHLGSKSGRGVINSEPGGFDAMLDNLDQHPPDVISLARINVEDWNRDFYDWVKERYQQVYFDKYTGLRLYVLKQSGG